MGRSTIGHHRLSAGEWRTSDRLETNWCVDQNLASDLSQVRLTHLSSCFPHTSSYAYRGGKPDAILREQTNCYHAVAVICCGSCRISVLPGDDRKICKELF